MLIGFAKGCAGVLDVACIGCSRQMELTQLLGKPDVLLIVVPEVAGLANPLIIHDD